MMVVDSRSLVVEWTNQPIWKICSSKWVHLFPKRGWTKTYIYIIWNHHLHMLCRCTNYLNQETVKAACDGQNPRCHCRWKSAMGWDRNTQPQWPFERQEIPVNLTCLSSAWTPWTSVWSCIYYYPHQWIKKYSKILICQRPVPKQVAQTAVGPIPELQ